MTGILGALVEDGMVSKSKDKNQSDSYDMTDKPNPSDEAWADQAAKESIEGRSGVPRPNAPRFRSISGRAGVSV